MASLVQDVWIGGLPRLRARRLAPYGEAPVRVVFHADLGQTLDEPDLARFLDALGARVDVVALEPRGQGGSSGEFGPEALDDLRELLRTAPLRWPDGRPLVLAGHGLGANLGLAAAAGAGLAGLVFLGPGACPPLPPFLEPLDLPGSLAALRIPLLAIDPRDGGAPDPMMTAFTSQPLATLLQIPGDRRAALHSPWAEVVATWAAFAATPH